VPESESAETRAALERQRVELKLEEHTNAITELRREHGETTVALRQLGTQMTRIETRMAEQIVAAKAVAANTVSNRTFILGVLAVIAVIIAALIQNGHL
jgi:cytochrome c-type biogenesis protein CcmH/NrfG